MPEPGHWHESPTSSYLPWLAKQRHTTLFPFEAQVCLAWLGYKICLLPTKQ